MSQGHTKFKDEQGGRVEVAKLRPCLRCEAPFESSWAGERVCADCKRTSAWRQGTSLAPQQTGRSHIGGR